MVRGAIDAGLVGSGAEAARFIEEPLPDWQPVVLGAATDSCPAVLVLQTGVGKVNAASAVMRVLHDHPNATIINLGICGLLPAFACVDDPACECMRSLGIGSVLLASASVYADEGVQMPSEFKSIGAMGFPLGPFGDEGVLPSPDLADALRPFADACRPIATVSTCSGTDALALEIATRTNAAGEAMEGAAIAHVIARHNALRALSAATGPTSDAPTTARFAELRVISNTTGDRARQQWDIPKAAAKLREVVCALLREPTHS